MRKAYTPPPVHAILIEEDGEIRFVIKSFDAKKVNAVIELFSDIDRVRPNAKAYATITRDLEYLPHPDRYEIIERLRNLTRPT